MSSRFFVVAVTLYFSTALTILRNVTAIVSCPYFDGVENATTWCDDASQCCSTDYCCSTSTPSSAMSQWQNWVGLVGAAAAAFALIVVSIFCRRFHIRRQRVRSLRHAAGVQAAAAAGIVSAANQRPMFVQPTMMTSGPSSGHPFVVPYPAYLPPYSTAGPSPSYSYQSAPTECWSPQNGLTPQQRSDLPTVTITADDTGNENLYGTKPINPAYRTPSAKELNEANMAVAEVTRRHQMQMQQQQQQQHCDPLEQNHGQQPVAESANVRY